MRDDELHAALRAEAESHRPDRDAMLARVTRAAMRPDRTPARRSGPRVRIAAAAAAVVTVLAGGSVANWALAGGDDTAPTPAVKTTRPSPAPPSSVPAPPPTLASTPPTATPPQRPASRPTAPATSRPTTRPAPGAPDGDRAARGPLRADGSINPDSGDDQGASIVTLVTTERLTRLEVTLRVTRTDGLISRGGTKQTPGASVTTTVVEEPDALLYRFVMSPADVLEPGTYTFTAKYRHPPGGRDAGRDTYRVVATTGDGSAREVRGGFATR